jgi:hypothetical protein
MPLGMGLYCRTFAQENLDRYVLSGCAMQQASF